MPVNVSKATATCRDCSQQLKGTFSLEVANWAFVTPFGLASGELTSLCAEHHNQKRQWGQENLPQHNEFDVSDGRRLLGEMRTATMVVNHPFKITDSELFGKYREEAMRLRRERG